MGDRPAVIVTGAASGIGRVLAEELGRRRTPVVLGDLDAGAAETVRQRIAGGGGRAWAIPVDVTRADEVERMVGEAVRVAGPVGGLVNCAGIYPAASFLALSAE